MRKSPIFQRTTLSKTIVIFIVLLLTTIILVSTVGLKILLNYSVFIANFFSKNKPSSLNKTVDVYGLISIDNIPTATNSATFIISGSVVNYEKIQFFINSEKVKEIDSLSNDSFSEEIGDLTEGENRVYIKVLSKDGKNSKKTDVYTVFFKKEKPKLEISEPKDGDKTSKSEINIIGSTDKEVFVKVNGLPITVDANGNFQSNLRLKEGENIIEILATDQAENIETKTLKITYQKEE
ncbi:hypothetical protein HZA76_04790 [Candidatus Roizmanbacteria bacterium]|nr:hypothetical protein [Candidatus Roizmanbacteria bacterium]